MKSQSTRRRALSPSNNTEAPRDAGYILAEVILAMAVLAVTASVILGSFSSSLRGARSSENITRGVMLLRELTAETITRGSDGRERGVFGERAPGFTWKNESGSSPCLSSYCPVTVTVEWKERGRAARVSSTVLAPRPVAKEQP